MPVIVDYTPVDTNMIASIGAGYAAEVNRRRRQREGVADQIELDSARTDQNIRQSQAAADYALQQAPRAAAIENAAAVSRARAMLPVDAARYRQQLSDAQAVHQTGLDQLRKDREAKWAPMEAQIGTNPPPHVKPWMVLLARNDYLNDGRIDAATMKLLSGPDAKEQVDLKDAQEKSDLQLKLLRRSVNAPGEAATAFRAIMADRGPVSPADEYIAKGIEQGLIKADEPTVRHRLGMPTFSEETAQTRAENVGNSENVLRLRVENDPVYFAAKSHYTSSLRTFSALKAAALKGEALEEDVDRAQQELAEAERQMLEAYERVRERLTGLVPNPSRAAPRMKPPPPELKDDPHYLIGAELLRGIKP